MKIKLWYFKPSGKYYADGDLEVSDDMSMYDVADIVEDRNYSGKLPGLQQGHCRYTVCITGEGHPQGFPVLLHA